MVIYWIDLSLLFNMSNPQSWSLGLITLVFFFFMIIKLDTCKIKHKSNIRMFICDCENLIESKSKKNIKTSLKSIKY